MIAVGREKLQRTVVGNKVVRAGLATVGWNLENCQDMEVNMNIILHLHSQSRGLPRL